MNLSIGIVGLPNVGKSTLFKVLTKNDVYIANYPFATIDPNVGIVAVPDERLEMLNKISNSAKKVPAVVEFYDIAGLVKGASQGQGLGNQFLSHIRETEAVIQVVRCFISDEIVHVEEGIDPLRDITIINMELMLRDLDAVEKRLGKLEGEVRTGDKEKIKEFELIKTIAQALKEEKMLYLLDNEILSNPAVKSLNLLTAKKQIYLLNGKESDVSQDLKDKITNELKADYIIFDLNCEPDLSILIRKAYQILNLISFFTTGEDETRAWTILNGSKAPQAAGTIHTDFENKFVKAEVISYEDLIKNGGWTLAKQKGCMRLEGKDYIVKDGDVMIIKHG